VSTARRGQAVWWDVAEKPGFEEYVHAHGATMVRLARLLTGDHDRAEDLVQDVLARAYPRWHLIVRADRPELYLRRMMVNLNASWWRRRASREVRVPDPEGLDLRDFGDQSAQRVSLWAEVAALPARQRAVVALRYYEDLDDQRISEILGCTPATVRTHAMRGLAAMRDRLRPTETENPMQTDQDIDTSQLAATAARAGRRRQSVRRSAIATAIAAFTAAAVAVPVLLWHGASSQTPGDGGLPDLSPPVRGEYALTTPPPATGPTAAGQPAVVGTDPFTLHFDLASFPYPVGEVRWAVQNGEESVFVELTSAEGYTRTLGVELVPGTVAAGLPTPDPTMQPVDPMTSAPPMKTSEVLIGDRPGTLIEPAESAGPGEVIAKTKLTWQPADGLVAVLSSDGLSAQDMIAVAAGLRLANHRCTIPLRITVQPPAATMSGCTYDTFHSGETVNVEVAFRSASKRLTVSAQPYRSDLLGPSASPAVKTSHGFTYAQVENGSYTALLYAEGPFPVAVFTEGAYGKADAVQVMDGLVASGDPKDPTTWPQNPIG
jgi:RNA polymerase sigma-70 factor (sigma-E family)